ncbi:MAG: response regulator [Elusimicrobiota bacterium]
MAEDRKKILHVEDDKSVSLIVKAILEKAGYQVISAFDAMQGIMMARQLSPNLVILDVMMPAGGGASVYDRIRMLNNTFSTPVLVYSAAAKADIQAKIPEGPLTLILQKPATPAQILDAVHSLLSAAS